MHTIVPKIRAGLMIFKKLIPAARIAVISLSSDSLPKVISEAINTAIGTAKATIHAKFRNKYSSIINVSIPLPRNRSIARSKNCTKRINIITNNENINGENNSLMIYRRNKRIVKVTIRKLI